MTEPSFSLKDVVRKSIIICYREDVDALHLALKNSGLHPKVLRATYSPQEAQYPAAIRCFLSHRAAWQRAAETDGYTLICEADFVPCVGLGTLPVFWPLDNGLAWGYLYQGSPRLLAMTGKQKFLRGHCGCTVAYVVNAAVAKLLLRFFDQQTADHGTNHYYNWESHLQWWLMGQGAEAYMPLKHYGEHGGLPNPEHGKSGKRRAGRHRADNLAGSLAFLPHYALGSRFQYGLGRIEGRVLGIARLITGRWIQDTNVYSRDWRKTLFMTAVGLRRVLA